MYITSSKICTVYHMVVEETFVSTERPVHVYILNAYTFFVYTPNIYVFQLKTGNGLYHITIT